MELPMPPFSYTSLKIIHDQKLHEALAQQRLYAEQETHKHTLLQTLNKFLARFHYQSTRKQETPIPDCAY